jgi:AcrR family transcriptional regulator
VLAATLDLLTERGPQGLAIAEVAERAGVHQTSLYRRWGTAERLMLDAMAAHSVALIPTPDTGSLHGDLVALGEALVAYYQTPLGTALSRTLAASEDTEETAAARALFWRQRRDECTLLVERAKARQEIAADVEPKGLLEQFIGPIHFRLLLTREAPDAAFLDCLAASIVRAFGMREAPTHEGPTWS